MDGTRALIADVIAGIARAPGRTTRFRSPLVGFADAGNPLFAQLRTLVAPDHLLPADLLPGARTVVSFFLPFTADLVRRNRRGPLAAPAWAVAQKEADEAIDAAVREVGARLAGQGIACSGNPESAPYDPARYLQAWSQRHVGYICGLGNVGLNQMLITRLGCAGRLGSFCISADLAPDPVQSEEVCPHRIDGSCGACAHRCPVQALRGGGIDKPACDAWITGFTRRFFGGAGAYRACGKCIALPCALERPRIR